MHIERLKSIKPTISISAPKKPSHIKQNFKKELQNLGKFQLIVWCSFRKDEWDLVPEQDLAEKDAVNWFEAIKPCYYY